MSSGDSTPQTITTTQNSDPWSGAQSYLSNVMSEAGRLYGSSTGYTPYSGSTQAGLDANLQTALSGTAGLAQQNWGGSEGVNAARALGTDLINQQGLTAGIGGALTGLGNTAGLYGNVYYNSGTPTQMYQNSYSQAAAQENPYLQSTIEANNRRIADRVNSAMSGAGRYGSGAHTDVLARSLAEASNPILAQDYQNRQQQMLQAAQGMLGVGQLQMGAAQGYGQSQQAIADVYGQGLNRAGQYSQLMPTMDEAQYAAADRLANVGNYLTNYSQQGLNSYIDQYNAQQAYPWEQLARYSAIVNGAGGLGGSQTRTQPNLNYSSGGLYSGLGGALTGAAAGTSIFGPGVGSLAGAGIGGLLGYFR